MAVIPAAPYQQDVEGGQLVAVKVDGNLVGAVVLVDVFECAGEEALAATFVGAEPSLRSRFWVLLGRESFGFWGFMTKKYIREIYKILTRGVLSVIFYFLNTGM